MKRRYKKFLKLWTEGIELQSYSGSWWTDFSIKSGLRFIFIASKEMQTYYYRNSCKDSGFEYCLKVLFANGLKDRIEKL